VTKPRRSFLQPTWQCAGSFVLHLLFGWHSAHQNGRRSLTERPERWSEYVTDCLRVWRLRPDASRLHGEFPSLLETSSLRDLQKRPIVIAHASGSSAVQDAATQVRTSGVILQKGHTLLQRQIHLVPQLLNVPRATWLKACKTETYDGMYHLMFIFTHACSPHSTSTPSTCTGLTYHALQPSCKSFRPFWVNFIFTMKASRPSRLASMSVSMKSGKEQC